MQLITFYYDVWIIICRLVVVNLFLISSDAFGLSLADNDDVFNGVCQSGYSLLSLIHDILFVVSYHNQRYSDCR